MKKISMVMLFATFLSTSSAFAVSLTSGKVTASYVLFYGSGFGIVRMNTVNANPPICGQALKTEWAFALDTPSGRATFNALLHAQAVGATVTIRGDGTCGAWGDRERPEFVLFEYPT